MTPPKKPKFHEQVTAKMEKGMPGHQAVAQTFAKAFPDSTLYKDPSLSKPERASNPLKGIRKLPS